MNLFPLAHHQQSSYTLREIKSRECWPFLLVTILAADSSPFWENHIDGLEFIDGAIYSLFIRFSRQYVILIVIASMIAIPAIQYVLSLWLESFAYRIEISWWIYIFSMLALIVFALFTISHQAISAALVNPVNVLKDE